MNRAALEAHAAEAAKKELDTTQQDTLRWLATGEVGVSSECMAFWLAFQIRTRMPRHPADPADLDRCLRLLDAAPGLRARLAGMATVSPEWAALVARWPEVEALFIQEVGLGWAKGSRAPQTYALMRAILDAVELSQTLPAGVRR